MLISSLDTASIRILLTAKEMSPTVRATATHCSNICAREDRNLLLYVWEIYNQHSQRNALGFFTGPQCIYIHFILLGIYKEHESACFLVARSWLELQGVDSLPLCISTCSLEAFFFLQDWVTHFEASIKTERLTERGFRPKDFRCMFAGWVFLFPRSTYALDREECREDGGTIETGSGRKSKVKFGYCPGKTTSCQCPAFLLLVHLG
jgi:hypothetical protein